MSVITIHGQNCSGHCPISVSYLQLCFDVHGQRTKLQFKIFAMLFVMCTFPAGQCKRSVIITP